MGGECRLAIGLMSGTSLDGVDAALIETDGEARLAPGPGVTIRYDRDARALLKRALEVARGIENRAARPGVLAEAEAAVTSFAGDAVARLLEQANKRADEIAVIGFHGQTVLHRPERRLTVQIGDAAALARRTGINVVHDLRAADVAAGGEGAPLVPVYHQALARALKLDLPAVFLNLGGVGNITAVSGEDDDLIAFDTGPGNALIDDWMQAKAGKSFDQDGCVAASGRIDQCVLSGLMDNDYFRRPPPKSLDRDDFSAAGIDGLSVQDGAATLVAFTAASVAAGIEHLDVPPRHVVLCGGGRHNPTLIAALGDRLSVPVTAIDDFGIDGDLIEAQAFGYLAVRSLARLPLTFPGSTGVPAPLTGGVLAGLR